MRLKPLQWGSLIIPLALAACSIDTSLLGFQIGNKGTTTASPPQQTNHEPIIKSLIAHRFKTTPDKATFWVEAYDSDGDALKYSWSATEGLLSTTAGTAVDLTAIATRSASIISSVLVSISDGKGGTAEGTLNIQFNTDGTPNLPLEDWIPQPTPQPTVPGGTSSPSPTQDVTATIIDLDYESTQYLSRAIFNPGTLTMKAGQRITFRNNTGYDAVIEIFQNRYYTGEGYYKVELFNGTKEASVQINEPGTYTMEASGNFSREPEGALTVN